MTDATHERTPADMAATITRLTAEIEQAREILAGTAVGALPKDYPLERLAIETWNTLQERTIEGLALVGKVEALTAELHIAKEWSARVLAGQQEDADTITRLTAEVERLRAVLREIEDLAFYEVDSDKLLPRRIARAALKEPRT